MDDPVTTGGNAMDALTTALSTGFGNIADSAVSAIGTIAPTALPVLGAMVVIGLAIKAFRKVGK